MSEKLPKGYATEEMLRNYFIGMGYYVVRGCKFKYNKFDVTDVDLLLYGKTSPLSRERINVDIKNKRTPQAIERIFWAKGLQSILDLDGCIVVTSENRPDVREFGLKHHVPILDGKFLARLSKSEKSQLKRITEEDFLNKLNESSNGKIGGDWKGRLEKSKSRLLEPLSFDGCNALLNEINFFFECASTLSRHSPELPTIWRVIYILQSYFLISLDFILREHLTAEQEQRRQLLDVGFRYGNSGKFFTERVGKMASALAGSIIPQAGIANTIEDELKAQSESIKSEILADYFCKSQVSNFIFDCAKEFDSFAYGINPVPPSALSSHSQAILGVTCDFFSLDRKNIFI
ncbi:Uncharacterised protein [Yersinia enterocolitica]|uniref:hypothetical protein n=1 Tax=Yersinia enterocolitica TaxID=630 RepID=UPI00028198F3|nr:hypothetical protein [Yersinia enterocolitica]AJI81479.1 hypothetical protein CH47_1223 [Yersinia enterocolitica]EKA27556.1 hypothetical protein YWA314_08514 [Yersinia enterocolitica subsp. enterocolitica WA-314]EKN3567294.1 hypothetical protein [Yersinia enterocolitica]EKN4887466.1 hypothetical protein [Yersinia enterocolitica]EKN4891660.1 hypothetical protein [Yersinia enterocolitica]